VNALFLFRTQMPNGIHGPAQNRREYAIELPGPGRAEFFALPVVGRDTPIRLFAHSWHTPRFPKHLRFQANA
jgi:hypothetical protein